MGGGHSPWDKKHCVRCPGGVEVVIKGIRVYRTFLPSLPPTCLHPHQNIQPPKKILTNTNNASQIYHPRLPLEWPWQFHPYSQVCIVDPINVLD